MAENPPITIEVSELTNGSSTWSHVFQGKNTTWPDSVGQDTLGNFFLGLQGQVQAHFNTQIPPGVTILSAEFEATPNVTNLSDPFDDSNGTLTGCFRATYGNPNENQYTLK